jgi:hypothetical protein
MLLVASVVLAVVFATSAVQPARADGAASTRAIILGAAALVAGVAINANVAHKRQLASTVVGYLPDGSTVYADGHVMLTNGQTYYPANYGQEVACSNNSCYITGGNGNGPYYANNGQYNNGNGPFGYAGTGPYYQNNPNNGYNPYYANNGNPQCPNMQYQNGSYQNGQYTYYSRRHRVVSDR